MSPIFYRISDLPPLLGFGRSKLFMEIRADRLRTTKVGRRTLVHRDDLDRYVSLLRDEANG